jgi:hypothetical protein
MSFAQASDCAGLVVTMFGEIARLRDETEVSLPLGELEETRVPPFLVKSV